MLLKLKQSNLPFAHNSEQISSSRTSKALAIVFTLNIFKVILSAINTIRHIKTLKVRVRDKHVSVLNAWAFAVNQVWSCCSDLSSRSIRERQVWLSVYDLQAYTKGASKELGLNTATVQMIGHEYATRRNQFKKINLTGERAVVYIAH
ncbi:hypothetical protein [Nitrincola iocasae]|uniref:Transposase n=1 Tax=Nitrincola iocasae TaxID=2614693 RepID=A0A5J6LA71_9GAMM|nr:hypothetical protein [Nitrincola iocasae]QEW05271.1 hypothetical protein F5I99_01485 [Nitrincola iocasae]